MQVNRAAAGEEEDEGRMGRVRKGGLITGGGGRAGDHRSPGLDLGLSLKNVPHTHTHTLPLTHCPGGRRNPRSWGKTPVLPRCVCARVLFRHTPHPTPPPNPVTPSLLLLRLWRRQLPTSCAGGSGVGKGGKRLNPSLWRLLLAGLGKRRERAAEGWGKRDRAPGGRQGPQRVSVSPRRDCGLQFKILA